MEQSILIYLEDELKEVYGSEFTIDQRETVGGGCISHATKLETSNGTFFLKWNSSCADDLFVREAECLRELKVRSKNGLLIPDVVFAKEADELSGFILLEYLEQGNSAGQDEKLGHGLALLHQNSGDQFGFFHDNYCGSTPQVNDWESSWVDFFAEKRISYMLHLIKKNRPVSSGELKIYDNLLSRLPDLLPSKSNPSLIHGDLWSGNYLFTAKGPALIDPAAYFADREMELAMMSLFGGFSKRTWDAYNETFPLEPGWQERMEIYQLYHILNHYYLFGGGYGAQALSIAKKFS